MPYLHVALDSNTPLPIRFKAPTRRMYKVTGIQFECVAGEAFTVAHIVDRAMEERELLASVDNPFFSGNLAAIGSQFVTYDSLKAKFLTISVNAGLSTGNCILIIQYELVKASKIDLIWEWFSKGS